MSRRASGCGGRSVGQELVCASARPQRKSESTEKTTPQRHRDTEGFLEQEIRRPGGSFLKNTTSDPVTSCSKYLCVSVSPWLIILCVLVKPGVVIAPPPFQTAAA